MKRVELEQGSEEWLAWRRKRGMASESAAVMGINPYQTIEQVRSIKRGTNKQYTNAAMERGHREEIEARKAYEKDAGELFQPGCFEMGEFGASVDGINMDGTQLLEIKSPVDARESDRWRLTGAPDAATRMVIVTAGCGASTAFAIGEETVTELFG